MSRPSALPSPQTPGEQAGADGAARRARRGRSRRRPAPPPRRGATPPEDCITSGAGRPARSAAASPSRPEVAAEQGGEVGVDRRRRAALVLAEAGQDLVRGGDVDAGQLARAGARRCAARGPGRGRRRAGRSATDSAPLSRTQLGQALAARPRPSGSTTPSGPIRSAASKRSSALDQRRRLRRAEPVELGPVLAADLEQVGEAAGGDQRRAGAAFLEQGVGADRHPVGEGLDLVRARRRPARAPPRPRRSPPRDWSSGVVGSFAVWIRSPSKRTASVKVPPTSTPSSTRSKLAQRQLSRRVSPSGPSTMWMPSSSGSRSGKSAAQVAAARLRRSRAQVAIAAASG